MAFPSNPTIGQTFTVGTDLYVWTGAFWELTVPTVPSGGTTILTGAGAPGVAVGANGDFYVDTVTADFYGPKTSGVWPPAVNRSSNTFTHVQAIPAVTWTINHNLGFWPDVSVVSAAGAEVVVDVQHVTTSQCVVLSNSAFAGTARLS